MERFFFIDKFQDHEELAGEFGLFDQSGKCLFHGSEADCQEELKFRLEDLEAEECWNKQNIFEE